ncbi:HYR domain-containing protein [Archangium gephyra]|nr:HYR domain-containing protein [Archangium gephyra]
MRDSIIRTRRGGGSECAPGGTPSICCAALKRALEVAYSHESGGVFPVGTTRVTASVVDRAGLRAECSFQVTVTRRVLSMPIAEGCACRVSGPGRASPGLVPWLLLGAGMLWGRRRVRHHP